MQRTGAKCTIPHPNERRPASRRWPLQLVAGAAVVCAVVLVLWWLSDGSEHPSDDTGLTYGAASQDSVPSDSGGEQRPTADPASMVRAPSAGDAEFIEQLERVSARRLLQGTPHTAEVADLVAAARIADAAALLESRAARGDRDAAVVLARLNAHCESLATSWQEARAPYRRQLEVEHARSAPVPAEVHRRIEVSLTFEQQQYKSMTRACSEARFDSAAIDQRLRSAAEAGHEASLWALGHGTADPTLRKKYWLSAAMLGHPQAQIDLAQNLQVENLRGDRRNRGQMNFWLEAAAKYSPSVKQGLGECLLNGCNAQPPDSEAAVPLLREAATMGELSAFQALASISRSDPAALSDEELYGLQSFLQQLNEMGCYGALLYPSTALESLRSAREIASRLSPHGLEQAQELAAANWRDYGAAAGRAQGCD